MHREIGSWFNELFGLAIIASRRIVVITGESQVFRNRSDQSFTHFPQEAVMTVRVIIERQVEPGQEARLRLLMTQSRSKAIRAKGYISGETLRALDDPNKFLILSNWNSAEDWKAWEKDPERAKLQQELAPLLTGNEKCTIYTHL
jgi:heme-degrading monooxygenase HmoA